MAGFSDTRLFADVSRKTGLQLLPFEGIYSLWSFDDGFRRAAFKAEQRQADWRSGFFPPIFDILGISIEVTLQFVVDIIPI
jgi:hypothetical protein